ncbi:sequestosome-1 [Anaeramoeba flamelloides]|uniref:Sequestosome-1 n=1 Tax=Anaeramoeba flamelloides TaxID=1746091 RepID=A0ABQ8YLI0_9EUKA|nr:sequestosome-1 [Anaeramoeba flamelloides]
MSSSKSIPIKTFYGPDIRRLEFDLNGNLNDLLTTIQEYYSIDLTDLSKYTLYYIDEDEEKITFSTDFELQEALRFASISTPRILRLFLEKVDRVSWRTGNNSDQKSSTNKNSSKKDLLKKVHDYDPPLPNLPNPVFYDLLWSLGDSLDMLTELMENKRFMLWLQTFKTTIIKSISELFIEGASGLSEFLVKIESLFANWDLNKQTEKKILKFVSVASTKIINFKFFFSILPDIFLKNNNLNFPNQKSFPNTFNFGCQPQIPCKRFDPPVSNFKQQQSFQQPQPQPQPQQLRQQQQIGQKNKQYQQRKEEQEQKQNIQSENENLSNLKKIKPTKANANVTNNQKSQIGTKKQQNEKLYNDQKKQTTTKIENKQKLSMGKKKVKQKPKQKQKQKRKRKRKKKKRF